MPSWRNSPPGSASLRLRPGGGIVLLAGDAGVGKTRLLTALRDLAVDNGWQVVAGHCLDFADSALPYLPFSEILGRLETSSPDLVAAVAGHHPALHRLAPGRRMMDEAGDSGVTTIDKSALFESVHALFEAVAEQQPLVLVVEDLHWADQSTRDLMSFLFTRPFSQPVALVASYRSDDLHRKHPLRAKLADWSRLQGVHRMSLEPLDPTDVRQLVADLSSGGADLTPDEIATIVERADGNAFFVEELVGATTATHDRGLPADLAELLLVRLDRLDENARLVVRAASVAGRRVTHELLAVAAELADGALDEGLRMAVERNVLVASDRHYAFRHALLGEAVYDDLLPGERVRLHARYAAAIRDGRARGTAAELARHAMLAHDDATALKASIQAGHEAAAVGGPDEAAQHFERALRLLSGLATTGETGRRASTGPSWPSTPPSPSAPAATPSGPPPCWPSSSPACPTTPRPPPAARSWRLAPWRWRRSRPRRTRRRSPRRPCASRPRTTSSPGPRCWRPTPTCWPCSGGTRRPSRSGSTPSPSPTSSTAATWPPR